MRRKRLAIRAGGPEHSDIGVVIHLGHVHLHVAVRDIELALVDERGELAGRGGGTDVVTSDCA
jgi:hypothetical protein